MHNTKKESHAKPLPDDLLDLLPKPSPCFVATLMPDGSPQLTQTWVTTDGENVVLNIVGGHAEAAATSARDPRVAVNVVDPANVYRFYAVRGRVVSMTSEGGRESIDEISQKYLGHAVSELHRSTRNPPGDHHRRGLRDSACPRLTHGSAGLAPAADPRRFIIASRTASARTPIAENISGSSANPRTMCSVPM